MSDTILIFLESQLPGEFRKQEFSRAVQAVVIFKASDVLRTRVDEIFSDAISGEDFLESSLVFSRSYLPGVSHPQAESLAQVLGISPSLIRVDDLMFHSLAEAAHKPALAHLQISWRHPAIEEVRSEVFSDWKKRVLRGQKTRSRRDGSFDLTHVNEIGLEFSADELKAIDREQKLRGKSFNRAELELIAQSWSEHCKHKIFAAEIHSEETLSSVTHGLFKTHIQAPTKELMSESGSHLLSVFHDNAGVIALRDYDGQDTDFALAFKMETHNSPSAIAPFGGASTGIVGVHRDILGTGQGSKPIANWDILCLESPYSVKSRPAHALSAKIVRSGVLQGIEEGGNQSGIPTVQGSIVFDADFAVKPYVFAGAVGLLPKKFVQKKPAPGLKLFCIGGAVGLDGLRGAVMSSRDLRKADFSGSAVQVANAFTQRRLTDALLDARDRGLIDIISDNGAGGLGSSCGELASLTGGALIDLTNLRTKTEDIHAWERLLSESQERMTVGTSQPEKFIEILEKWKVPFDVLGETNTSKNFTVLFKGQELVSMRLDFLFNLCPRMLLTTCWNSAKERQAIIAKRRAQEQADSEFQANGLMLFSLENIFLRLLDSEHLCSRKAVQQRFDHEVQGRNLRKAFQGEKESSPSDGSLIEIFEMQEFGRGAAVVLAHGLCPWRESIEEQVLFAFDEAFRQMLLAGAQWGSWAGIDNFCWPDPVPAQNPESGERHLWRLVRANEVLSQLCRSMKLPLISGKDSMKNNSKEHECPATLVVSMGASSIDPVLVPVAFVAKANDVVLWLAPLKNSLRGSCFERVMGVTQESSFVLSASSAAACTKEIEDVVSQLKKRYESLHGLISKGFIRAARDVGEGGLGITLAEMCFGREMGIHLETNEAPRADRFFGEGLGSFVLVVDPHHVSKVREALPELRRLGVTMKYPALKWNRDAFEIPIQKLKNAYEKKGREGFFA